MAKQFCKIYQNTNMIALCNIMFAIFNYFNYSITELTSIIDGFIFILGMLLFPLFCLWCGAFERSKENGEKTPPVFQYMLKKLSQCLLVLNIVVLTNGILSNIYANLYKFKIDNYKGGIGIVRVDRHYYKNYERTR